MGIGCGIMTGVSRGGRVSHAAIQSLHNGITPPDSLTTGPLWVRDYLDQLVSAGADALAIPGMRLDGDTFVNDDGAGTALYPSQQVRTRQGTVTQYTGDYKGMQVAPAMTNKITCRKVNPVDTTNLTKTGDAAAVLSVVDDSAALAAAGLDKTCTSGKVYKLDNSAGTGSAYAQMIGSTGNLNKHSARVYARRTAGSPIVGVGSEVDWASIGSSEYAACEAVDVTPQATGNNLSVKTPAGSIIYFILPELIESPYLLDSPVVPLPTDDALTSYTRAATVAQWNSAGRIREQNCAVWGRVVPGAAGQTIVSLFGAYIDLSNRIQVFASPSTAIEFKKVFGGSDTTFTISYTHSKDTPFEYQAFWSDQGMAIRVKEDGGAWSAWATNANADPAPIASTFQIGARNGANQFAATYPFTATAFLPTQATLAEYQEWIETNTQWNVLGVSA